MFMVIYDLINHSIYLTNVLHCKQITIGHIEIIPIMAITKEIVITTEIITVS